MIRTGIVPASASFSAERRAILWVGALFAAAALVGHLLVPGADTLFGSCCSSSPSQPYHRHLSAAAATTADAIAGRR